MKAQDSSLLRQEVDKLRAELSRSYDQQIAINRRNDELEAAMNDCFAAYRYQAQQIERLVAENNRLKESIKCVYSSTN